MLTFAVTGQHMVAFLKVFFVKQLLAFDDSLAYSPISYPTRLLRGEERRKRNLRCTQAFVHPDIVVLLTGLHLRVHCWL